MGEVAGFECHLVNERAVIPFPPVSTAKFRGWRGFDQQCWLKKLSPLAKCCGWYNTDLVCRRSRDDVSRQGLQISPGSWGSTVLSCWQLSSQIRKKAEKTQGTSPSWRGRGQATGFLHGASDAGKWSLPGREMCPPT